MTRRPIWSGCALCTLSVLKRTLFLALLGLLAFSGAVSAQDGRSPRASFIITAANWSGSGSAATLTVQGTGSSGRTVTIRNAGNGAVLGDAQVRERRWTARISGLSQVPCTISAQQSNSSVVLKRAVSGAPSNCGPVAGQKPTLSIASRSANEGNSGTRTLVFTATLSTPAPVGGVRFSFATANGTATAGSDYVAASGTRTIAAGTTTANIPVTLNGDTAVEANETFTVNLTGATNTANATASATGTLLNDDQTGGALPTLSIASQSANEGNSGTSTMTFTATLSAPAPTGGVSFSFATANGTATTGSDYVATSGTRTIAAGTTTANIPVTLNGDTAVEANETFTVNLTGATNTANATASATGTLLNDDQTGGALPTLSIASQSANEGNSGTSTMTFTATLSAPAPTGGVSFSFATANGTATTGSDYVATSGTRTIAAGTTTANIPVTLNGDTAVEANETFTVNLTGATNTANATASATGTLVNDDQAAGPVGVLPTPNVAAANYVVVGSNDLGMHCADQDYQVFSILPPFNVLHAQVIRKGTGTSASTLPAIIDGSAADLYYAASSSATDPAGAGSINTGSAASAFKSNFWTAIAGTTPQKTFGTQTYRGLYPVLGAASSALDLFAPLSRDIGLPAPDANDLPNIVPFQQAMPAVGSGTPTNSPQAFKHYYPDLAFFNLPLTGLSGSPKIGFNVTGLNAFAAEGIPILPVDDAGRDNAYPLMRIGATLKASANGPAVPPNSTGSNVVGALDIVVPVASEADCQSCHAAVNDPALTALGFVSNGSATDFASAAFSLARSNDANALGADPTQKLLNAAKINILRLHDKKHGASYKSWSGTTLSASACTTGAEASCLDKRRNIQCSQCHYTPALDLAQVGPIDEAAQGANGRQQRSHISMSRAMHGHHGDLVFNGSKLFPDMPASGPNRTAAAVNDVLENTCYHCHPGKKTQCMRGAMTAASASNPGGQACQDCHGNMTHVGNDFSESFAATPGVAASGKRVPWRNEPKCQSCHIGDATTAPSVITSLGGTGQVIQRSQVQTQNGAANTQVDNIRLLRAYTNSMVTQPVLTNISVPTSRFAENQDLYRLSAAASGDANKRGHGGVMCRACHGATHSEWPNAQAAANDNVAANQLQSHAGPVAECSACHGNTNLGNSLNGPHGLHAIGPNSPWASASVHGGPGGNYASCQPCHGGTSRSDSQGTVLSRATANKTIGGRAVTKGTPIGCQLCH